MPVEPSETQGWRRERLVYIHPHHEGEIHKLGPNKLVEVLRSSQGWKMELGKGYFCSICGKTQTTEVQPENFTGFTSRFELDPTFGTSWAQITVFQASSCVLNFFPVSLLIWNFGSQCHPEAWRRKECRSYSRSNDLFTNYSPFSPNHLWLKNTFICQVFSKVTECLEMSSSYRHVWIWVICSNEFPLALMGKSDWLKT